MSVAKVTEMTASSSTSGDPVTYAETPDGTQWIVTQSAGGGHHTLWRGAGATPRTASTTARRCCRF